jgi:hypothetical protein
MTARAAQFEFDIRPKLAFSVEAIEADATYPLLLNVHYARRLPSISYAFGLFIDGVLQGVVTYGTPSSAPLRSGIAGQDWADKVLELNRLCLHENRHNQASRLVAASLKMLPRPSLVVSFADTEQGHIGTVYQACNFTYCGLSEKRTDWKVAGMEHLHGQTIADKFRGADSRAQAMRNHFGNAFYLKQRSRKHRYVAFIGSHKEKRQMRNALRYSVQPYPKAVTT